MDGMRRRERRRERKGEEGEEERVLYMYVCM
jgi:hypothetical protein